MAGVRTAPATGCWCDGCIMPAQYCPCMFRGLRCSWKGVKGRCRSLSMDEGGRHPWLQGRDECMGRPLPCKGKVVVRYKGRSAEARLQLPLASTRAACAEELAAVGWLTIGLLATDGIAVQVQ